MVFQFHRLPSVDGIRINGIAYTYVLYHSSLIIISHIAHLSCETVHARESLAESSFLDKAVVGIVPSEIVVGLPSASVTAFQNMVTNQLQPWGSSDSTFFT